MFGRYLRTLVTVLSSATGYRGLLLQPLTSALGFFCLSMALLSLSTSLRFQVRQLPEWRKLAENTWQEIATHFPEDLVATWDGQRLDLQGTPVSVNYPSFFMPSEWQLPSQLLQIEKETPGSEKLNQTQSLFFLSQTELSARNRHQEWISFPVSTLLEGQPTFTLNQETLPSFLALAKAQVESSLQFLGGVFFLLAPGWLIVSRLWEVLFNSLFLFFFLRFDGRRWPWKKAFQLGLYLAVPAEVIFQVTTWLYPSLTLPMFSLSFWVLAVVVYLSGRTNSAID